MSLTQLSSVLKVVGITKISHVSWLYADELEQAVSGMMPKYCGPGEREIMQASGAPPVSSSQPYCTMQVKLSTSSKETFFWDDAAAILATEQLLLCCS
ncbi:MAG: hypothetical protein M3Z08_20220 [Chloroflexota bacterium]|nr:hypothetical protein [Chloroflexota bacterium]